MGLHHAQVLKNDPNLLKCKCFPKTTLLIRFRPGLTTRRTTLKNMPEIIMLYVPHLLLGFSQLIITSIKMLDSMIQNLQDSSISDLLYMLGVVILAAS